MKEAGSAAQTSSGISRVNGIECWPGGSTITACFESTRSEYNETVLHVLGLLYESTCPLGSWIDK